MTSVKALSVFCLTYSFIGIIGQILPPTFDFIGSRRPGTTCTFNPCTVPNFCGLGRSCDIDENCISRCVCEEDSKHPDCSDTVTNNDVAENINPTLTINNTNKDISNQVEGSKEQISDTDTYFKENPIQSIEVNKGIIKNSQHVIENNKTLTENRSEFTTNNKQFLTTNKESTENQELSSHITTNSSNTFDCMFDPCDKMSWLCDGGRQCVNRACIVHCECTAESTHISCGSGIKLDTNTKENCGGFTGMKCLHGKCVQIGSSFSCQCDSQWKGAICDLHASTGCTRKCGPGFECTWLMDNMQICTKIKTIQGEEDSTLIGMKEQPIVFNVCLSEYTFHPEFKRNCTADIRCQFGICRNEPGGAVSCHCDPGAFGITCNQTCCRDCGAGGECVIDGDHGDEQCRCYHNYTGINCTEFKSREANSQWYIWVVGTCSIVLVALIVVLVIIPYFMWKYRVILVMKVVHYFQGFEDDDEREWDAFISYKSSAADEQFVTQVLFPKLEDEFGFKLHVHYRDFIPGDTIANNIIRAVKGSRRSILIITPQYAEGEYTKLEYQVAQQQMLKHKHRIIPILLDDISECKETLDPNLKFILRSVTYLEWPHDNSERRLNRFWKRIQLSMPKKRNQNPRNMIRGRIQALENGAIKRNCRLPVQLEQNGVLNRNLHFENEHDHYDRIKDIERL